MIKSDYAQPYQSDLTRFENSSDRASITGFIVGVLITTILAIGFMRVVNSFEQVPGMQSDIINIY